MADKPNFRDPVFVRDDDTTTIRASVVEWNNCIPGDQLSVRISNGGESVLINLSDWPTLVSCINREMEKLQ